MTASTILYCECRTYGHAWFEIDADKASPIGWYLWLKCERCSMIRMDTIDVHGELSARSYRQPAGYHNSEKITRATYRTVLHEHRERARRSERRRKAKAR